MKIAIITIGILLLGILILTIKNRRTNNVDTSNKPKRKKITAQLIEQLEHADYFNYADMKDIDTLKEEMLLNSEYGISTLYHDTKHISLDYRNYHLDGEDLFEEGGFNSIFEDLKDYIKKSNLSFNVEQHIETWDEKNGLNHSYKINGETHLLFENFDGTGWGEAALQFGRMFNDILESQNKIDRVYLISGGNDGSMMILTPEQYHLIETMYSNDEWKPRSVDDWSRFMKIQ